MLHPKDTNCIFCLFSFFLKERKWQKKNSRDLAKFQNLLERRRLVGREKSLEITGSLFRKCFCFCLPCYVAREEFFITVCEVLSSTLSPNCTKSLVTKRKPVFHQSWCSFSALVSSWSSYSRNPTTEASILQSRPVDTHGFCGARPFGGRQRLV